MSSQAVYGQIIQRIKRIYDSYEERANQLGQDKRAKTGTKADKAQQEFLRALTKLQENLTDLSGQMKKNQKGSSNQYREHQMTVEECLKDIRIILKKRPLNFKVNRQIRQIIEDTESSLVAVRKDLAFVKQTKFLCCGTDGQKKFKTPMSYFKVTAAKWKMLTLFEPKDGIQTFVSPKFSEGDYNFIGQILRKKWPESKETVVEKVVTKQVIKQVIKNTGTKPNRLHDANQFLYGINKEQNIIEGLNIYHEEADNNNPQACTFLGKVYQEGILLPMDIKKSMSYYQKGMSGKEPYAHYRFALCLINGKFSQSGQKKEDIEKGFQILKQISTQSPQAMAQLGQIHQFGHFQNDVKKLFTIAKDEKKAKTFYNKAKSMNLSRASNNLAVLLLNNKLSEKQNKSDMTNNNQADKTIITLLTQAQEQGFSQAYYNLGVIYSKGLIGQRNSQLALKMFYQGSIKGDYKCKIHFAYQLMNQTSIMKEQYEDHYHLAIHWLESVVRKLTIDDNTISTKPSEIIKSERGEALYYLGLFHQHGFGVEKSPKKAISYFIQSSSDCDYAPAKNKIGDCYFSGYGIKQDRQLAVGCYIQAAQMNNSDAMVNLGTVYLNGIPGLVQRSYKKAYEYFLGAHELENSDAMIHLSMMYQNGLGVDPNQSIAKDLLEQAAQLKNATALYMLRQRGLQFNQGVLFEHLQNQFFSAPKKINMKEIVPAVNSIYKSRI